MPLAGDGQVSSAAQDLARGRRSEIDHLNGHIVRAAAELGVAAPVNRSLLVTVRLAEARAGAAGP
jgi:2-dehydropantoate 2-reductase